MPKTFNLSVAAANEIAHAMNNLLGGAMITIYDGQQPEDADSPISPVNHPLATFQFPPSGLNLVAEGVINFGTVPDTIWTANGKASFARVSKSGLVLFDCSVGISNADMVINANPVIAGAVAHIVAGSSYTVRR